MEIKITEKCMATSPFLLLDRTKYAGKGRPKKSDYEYTTIEEIQEKINAYHNKRLDWGERRRDEENFSL